MGNKLISISEIKLKSVEITEINRNQMKSRNQFVPPCNEYMKYLITYQERLIIAKYPQVYVLF